MEIIRLTNYCIKNWKEVVMINQEQVFYRFLVHLMANIIKCLFNICKVRWKCIKMLIKRITNLYFKVLNQLST